MHLRSQGILLKAEKILFLKTEMLVCCQSKPKPMLAQMKEDTLSTLNSMEGPQYISRYINLLQGCIKQKALSEGRLVHAHIIKSGLMDERILENTLINMYAKCGSLVEAHGVFEQMPSKDVFSWTAMISAHAKQGLADVALGLFQQMQWTGIQPDQFIFASVLPACASLAALRDVHGKVVVSGLEADVFVGSILVDMYAKRGSVENSRHVFDKMPQRDAVSWNNMVAGYAGHGLYEEALMLFYLMQQNGNEPNQFAFAIILSACAKLGALQQGVEIHGKIARSGFRSDIFLVNGLIDLYAKCGNTNKARSLFDRIDRKDVVSWNAMIAGYAQNGECDRALKLFQAMQLVGVKPDSKTFASVVSACASLTALEQGMEVHKKIIGSGCVPDVFVGSALIDMYAKCGSIEKAVDVFEKLPQRNSVSWTTMIAGYAQKGYFEKALELFHKMPERNVVAWNAIIAGYSQNGHVEEASKLFQNMPQRNLVSWNSMIAGYAQNGHAIEALNLFQEMKLAGVKPNSKTYACALAACASLAALEQGTAIHEEITTRGLQYDIYLGSALVDMYAKCGSVGKARDIFDNMKQHNVITCTAMIAGYAMNGNGKEALKLFEQMQCFGMNPNHVTFICVLTACCHAGLVYEGQQFFNSMIQDFQIRPTMEHYGCMVDLLGRAGYLDEAQNFIKNMPIKVDATVWGCLLGACTIHNNVELGKHVAEQICKLDHEETTPYVLLSNLYATAGRWDDIEMVRKTMNEKKLNKVPGGSWIEVDKHIHTFFIGEKSYPQTPKIYSELERLSIPQTQDLYQLM